MRRIVAAFSTALFVLSFGTLALAADASVAWHDNMSAAWQRSQQTQRPIVVLVTMEGCHYCHKMMAETYSDPQVMADLQRSFIPASINSDHYPKLMEQLGVEAFPTTVIIGPDARVIDSIEGYVEPRQLRQHLVRAASHRQAIPSE